jgi:pilus assembly protein Flp/PilA
MIPSFLTYLNEYRRDEGQGLVEYALILSLVSIAAIIALTALSGGLTGVYGSITGSL